MARRYGARVGATRPASRRVLAGLGGECGRWLLRIHLCTGLAILLTAGATRAQSIEQTDTQLWLQYEFLYGISERLQGSWDVGFRQLVSTEAGLADWSRAHFESDLRYTLNPLVRFELGGGGYYTFQESLPDRAELRLWQGAVVRWPSWWLAGREFDLRHRFRLEQRWVTERGTGEDDLGLRFRYRLDFRLPLNRPTANDDGALYLRAMNEWFADLGSSVPEFFAARVRLSAALGYALSENWQIEARYTGQRSRDTVLDVFTTTDHIFDLRVRTRLRVTEWIRGRGDRGAP